MPKPISFNLWTRIAMKISNRSLPFCRSPNVFPSPQGSSSLYFSSFLFWKNYKVIKAADTSYQASQQACPWLKCLYFTVTSNIVVRLLKSFMILSVPNGSLHCQHSSLLCKNMQNLTSFVELAKQYIQ